MQKGQLTVFIIIGLVILLSVGVFIYIYGEEEISTTKAAPRVPESVQPIYDYVTSCITQVGRDALTILGLQGGYIYLPAFIERNPQTYVNNDPLGITKTPFWYFEGEERTPPLIFMQREIENYLKNNLQECVGDFDAFKDRYSIRASALAPTVNIGDETVLVSVQWPIEITRQNSFIKLDSFAVDFSVKLKEMWELAAKTMSEENKQGWFENLTMDLMSASPDIPLSGLEFSCGTKRWHIQEIKKDLQEILYYNIPSVKVVNTNIPPPLKPQKVYDDLKKQAAVIRYDLEKGKDPDWPTNVPEDAFEVNRMRMNVGIPKTDLKAAFTYLPDWPLLVNAQPNKGGVLSTALMKGPRKYLRFLCLNQWHFAYNLIYPVKMTIRDDSAFNNEGYLFQFAFPVIIQDNEESRVFFGLRKFVVPDLDSEFCTQLGNRDLNIKVVGFVEGDPIANELEGVNITYKCLNQECRLGQTYNDGSGEIKLSTFLPEGCGDPLIVAHKDGYLTNQKQATEQNIELILTRLKRMNYSIIVHPFYEEVSRDNPFVATNAQWLEPYTKFANNMRATVSLTLRNGNLDQYLNYPASITQDPGAKDELEFIFENAKYDLDVLLFKDDITVGGYHAENLTISYDELVGNENAQIHVVEYRPLPEQDYQRAGMFVFLYERGTYKDGTLYAEALKPTFTP